MIRKSKKIDPHSFVVGFMFCFCKKNNTYSEWAEQTGKLSGTTISKWGLCKRITESTVTFCKELLEKTVTQKLSGSIEFSLFKHFQKVILQDSTTLQLPDCLSVFFSWQSYPWYSKSHSKNTDTFRYQIHAVFAL